MLIPFGTIVSILLIGMVGFSIFATDASIARLISPHAYLSAAEATPALMTVEGELVCLPHRAGHTQTFECVVGLRDSGGRYYGLRHLDQQEIATGRATTGQWVQVTGRFMPGPMEPYDTVGTIEVHSMVQANREK
jgi:hypothetical protein